MHIIMQIQQVYHVYIKLATNVFESDRTQE